MLAKLQGEDRIVKLHDYELDEGREVLYVVMEKGDTDLASLLKNYAMQKEITPAMVKHYWTEMLHAVSVIHKVLRIFLPLLFLAERIVGYLTLFMSFSPSVPFLSYLSFPSPF